MVPPSAQRGFTLIEMIVVLAVVSLLVGLVLARGPAHSQALDLDAAARRVVGTLRVAHARAIAEDRPVLVSFTARNYQLDNAAPLALPGNVLLAGDRAVRFMPDGGSSGGGIVLRAGALRIIVSVDWLTGRIAVEDNG